MGNFKRLQHDNIDSRAKLNHVLIPGAMTPESSLTGKKDFLKKISMMKYDKI